VTPGIPYKHKNNVIPVIELFNIRAFKKTTAAMAERSPLSKAKDLMRSTVVVHLRYKSLYISLPSSAKQQREMTKFVQRT